MTAPSACRSAEEWKRLLSQPLAPGQAGPVAAHLENCSTCAATVEAVLGKRTIVDTRTPADIRRVIEGLRGGAAEPGHEETRTAGGAGAAPGPILSPPRGGGEIGWLGTYRVLRQLGEGGMGIVYLAEDSVLQRPVALKVMQPQFAASADHRERFAREARAAAAIEHDHIVPIYQVREANGVPFLAMKLLQGESLNSYLKRSATMTPTVAMRLGRQIALGLAAAHARGLIHRDIKPANIWLEKEPAGRVKLLDFGLARGQDNAHLTAAGVIVGTPSYMSPEQARAEIVDARADLFSLGVVLYRVLAGRLPFMARDGVSTLIAVSTLQPAPLRALNPDVPTALDAVVMRLLEKDPSRRPASAAETAQLLEAAMKAPPVVQPVQAIAQDPAAPTEVIPVVAPIRVTPRRRARKSRRGLWIVLSAVALLAATVALIVYLTRSSGPPRDETKTPSPPEPRTVVRPPSRYLAIHGVDSAALVAWAGELRQTGYRPISLSGYTVGGKPLFAAIAVKNDEGYPWELRHDLPSEGYQQLFTTELTPRGYRAISVTGFLDGNVLRYGAVWIQEPMRRAWWAHHNRTAAQTQDAAVEYGQKGMQAVCVAGYTNGTEPRFSSIFTDEPGNRIALLDLSPEEYVKTVAAWTVRRYRPLHISAYQGAGGTELSVVFIFDDGTQPWEAHHDLTADQYQKKVDDWTERGYRPLCITGYAEEGSARYATIWVKEGS
jgi:serine/threonine protein kinase